MVYRFLRDEAHASQDGRMIKSICCLCGFFAISLLPASAEENVILYGGVSYIDEATTPAMANMLANDASGQFLTSGDEILIYAEQAIEQVNQSGGLKGISEYPIVQSEAAAIALAASKGSEPEAGEIISSFQLQGTKIYGLLLLANYEDVIPQTLQYTDPTTGNRKAVKKRTYVVGMSALLLELNPGSERTRIVLSSSDLGRSVLTSDVDFVPSEEEKAERLGEAYKNAADGALRKLSKARLGKDRSRSNHMVTGFSMSDAAPAELLNFDLANKPTAQDLSTNLCSIPTGCTSQICRKRGAMLMHSLTSSLSEAGYSVLPPITAEYVGDVANGIELNLSLFGDEARLLGEFQAIEIDPSDAATKWVAVWRGSQFIDLPSMQYPDLITDRVYFSRVGYVRGSTGFDGCSDVTGLERDPVPAAIDGRSRRIDGNIMGCSVENYLNSQGAPGRGVARDHYTLAALDHVSKLGSQLRGERVSNDLVCEPFAGAD